MSSAAIRGGKVAIEIGADVKRFYSALNKIQSQIRTFGSTVNRVGLGMTGLGTAAAAPFMLAARTSAGFQDTMAAVGAVSGATGEEFEALRDKALELGASTSFTAQQAAEGLQALGQGGFSVGESLSAIDGTLLLARAGMLDLGQATSITVAILRSFKMPAEEAGNVADVLAMAANKSNADVSSLGEALSMVGGIAYSVGGSLQEVTAAVGLLADRGLDGSTAGTALRRVFIGLAQEQKKLKELGVEVKDPNTGKLKPLKTILEELRAAMSNMDEVSRLDKLSKIFDVFGANAVLMLMNSTDALGSLTGELNNAAGSSAEVAKKMDDTLGGSLRMMLSAIEAVALSVGYALTPSLRSAMDTFRNMAAGIAAAISRNKEFVAAAFKATLATIAIGGALIATGAALQVVAFAVGGFGMALKLLTGPIGLVTSLSTTMVGSLSSGFRFVQALSSGFVRAAASILAFAGTAASGLGYYIIQITNAAAITIGRTIAISAAWAAAGVAMSARFLAHVKAMVTYYTGALSSVVAITIQRAGAIAAAWITQAGMSIGIFAATALNAIGVYLGSLVMAVGGTLSAAASMATAWLVPLAPIAGLVAAIGGIAYAIQAAFSNSGNIAGSLAQLFPPLTAGFQQVARDATEAFSDIYSTATTTFSSISDAVSAGEIGLAFEALWAGISAVWLRGQQLIMGYVDPFIEYLQNRWGDLTTGLAVGMLRALGLIERAWIGMTGGLFAAWDFAINSVMNLWDSAVGAIQKAIAYIRSFFDKSIDYDKIRKQIDEANKQRKEEREKRSQDNANQRQQQIDQSMQNEEQAVQNVREDNQRAQDERADRSRQRADERQQAVDAADQNVQNINRRAQAAREATDIMGQVGSVAEASELQALYQRAQQLFEAGLISEEMMQRIESAADERAVELDKERAMRAQQDAAASANAADTEDAKQSVATESGKRETAGTFSAFAALQFGVQGNAAERTAKAAEETARNTRDMKPRATT